VEIERPTRRLPCAEIEHPLGVDTGTQHARRAIDPLLSMAEHHIALVLAVAHPNRAEGDLRARVGLSAVLRQAAPMLLFAIDRQAMTRSGSWGSANAPPAHRQPSAGKCHAITRCLPERFERSKRSPTHPDRRPAVA
jgi:hypothetical protein